MELGRQHTALRAALLTSNSQLDILLTIRDEVGEGKQGESVGALELNQYHRLLQDFEDLEAECAALRLRELQDVRSKEKQIQE